MIERTFDIEKINSVLKHDDIWPNIADDEVSKEEFEPPLANNHYLYEEGVLFILHNEEEGVQIHANVLKDYRNKSTSAAKNALEYGFIDMNAKRIFCEIPLKYKNVYKFASKFLKDKGIKNGNHILDLRAEEWVSSEK